MSEASRSRVRRIYSAHTHAMMYVELNGTTYFEQMS